jgi:hypothetical protein
MAETKISQASSWKNNRHALAAIWNPNIFSTAARPHEAPQAAGCNDYSIP